MELNNRQMRQLIHEELKCRFKKAKRGIHWLITHNFNPHVSKMFYHELKKCLAELKKSAKKVTN